MRVNDAFFTEQCYIFCFEAFVLCSYENLCSVLLFDLHDDFVLKNFKNKFHVMESHRILHCKDEASYFEELNTEYNS